MALFVVEFGFILADERRRGGWSEASPFFYLLLSRLPSSATLPLVASLLEDIMRGAVDAAKGLGAKVATRGLDAAFEDLEGAGAEWVRRVQRARRRIKWMEEHPGERFSEDPE